MVIMAVDYGESRTGIAVCDRSEMLASPLTVLHETSKKKCLAKTAELAAEYKAEEIVVGLPKNMNNTEGERAEKSRAFADELGRLTGLPVKMWDERLTTVGAAYYLNETNVRGKKRKNVIDAAAAVLILEGYMGSRRNSRYTQIRNS